MRSTEWGIHGSIARAEGKLEASGKTVWKQAGRQTRSKREDRLETSGKVGSKQEE